MLTIEETQSRYETILNDECESTVARVEVTTCGSLEIDVVDCTMCDLDAIHDVVGVRSVERRPAGPLRIESRRQVTPCTHGRELAD